MRGDWHILVSFSCYVMCNVVGTWSLLDLFGIHVCGRYDCSVHLVTMCLVCGQQRGRYVVITCSVCGLHQRGPYVVGTAQPCQC